MGRHRSPKSNSGVAKELVIGCVAVLAVVAALLAWVFLRDTTEHSHSEAAECPKGDLTVPYASLGDATVPQQLFDDFLATQTRVQDYCVSAFTTAQPGNAALIATSWGTPQTQQQLSEANRTAATDHWPIATLQGTAPAEKITRIAPLAAVGSVTEEQSRAAAEFAKFVSAKGLTASPSALEALNSPAPTPSAPAASPAAPAPTAQPANTDTLILLDTSESMGPYLAEVTRIAGENAHRVGAAGGHVGLWNYSSPLSPGVTKSWRDNVSLTDDSQGDRAAQALAGLGYGGVPHTSEALLAADAAAQDYARETGREVRIVVLTSGTADGVPPAELKTPTAAIQIGPGARDPQLAKVVRSSVTLADTTALDAEMRKALGL